MHVQNTCLASFYTGISFVLRLWFRVMENRFSCIFWIHKNTEEWIIVWIVFGCKSVNHAILIYEYIRYSNSHTKWRRNCWKNKQLPVSFNKIKKKRKISLFSFSLFSNQDRILSTQESPIHTVEYMQIGANKLCKAHVQVLQIV